MGLLSRLIGRERREKLDLRPSKQLTETVEELKDMTQTLQELASDIRDMHRRGELNDQ